jgi:sugar/nucleoside kinase (ribokinase family)
MTIMGDARIELRSRLPGLRFTDVNENRLEFEEITTTVSGTAVNLAVHAVDYFDPVVVVAKVGNDAFTPLITDFVLRAGAVPVLRVVPDAPNRATMVVRDRDDARLLVADPNQALAFAPEDVLGALTAITTADILVCDGYSMLTASSREAVAVATRAAQHHGGTVCLDLVPHDIDQRLDRCLLLSWLATADVVIAEGRTLGRLVGVPVPDPCTTSDALRLRMPLTTVTDRRPLWLIRHGQGDMDRTLAYRADDISFGYRTGYSSAAEKMGFGDRMAAAELYWWCSRTTTVEVEAVG